MASGIADLHLFLGRHSLKHLAARQAAFALRLGHLVQIMKLLHEPLLLGLGQTVEAGIVVQQPLLVLQGKALMLVKP